MLDVVVDWQGPRCGVVGRNTQLSSNLVGASRRVAPCNAQLGIGHKLRIDSGVAARNTQLSSNLVGASRRVAPRNAQLGIGHKLRIDSGVAARNTQLSSNLVGASRRVAPCHTQVGTVHELRTDPGVAARNTQLSFRSGRSQLQCCAMQRPTRHRSQTQDRSRCCGPQHPTQLQVWPEPVAVLRDATPNSASVTNSGSIQVLRPATPTLTTNPLLSEYHFFAVAVPSSSQHERISYRQEQPHHG